MMLKKYSLVTTVALFSASMLMQSTALADSVDHWVKLKPDTLLGKISLAMRSKVGRVPSIRETHVPVYPGAKIYLFLPHGFSSLAEKEDKRALPRFSLVSGDSPSKVVNFYNSRLDGYGRVKNMRKNTLFLKDTGQDAVMAKHLKLSLGMTKSLMRHPSVYIVPASSLSLAALPGAKSIIQITYRPQQSNRH